MTLAKNKPTAIAPKIKQAIQFLLTQERFDFTEAARVAGIAPERLRDEMLRPHTRKYLRKQSDRSRRDPRSRKERAGPRPGDPDE